MDKYRIVLCDDHVLVRRGFRNIIETNYDDLEIVGEAGDGFELLEIMKTTSPNLILMDISMPNLRGLEATKEVKIINSDIKVLIVTMHKDKEYVFHAFSAGADGYLLKADTDDELIAAIDTIRRGETYISPLLASQMKDLFVEKVLHGKGQAGNPAGLLTTREREILKLIAEGKSTKEISALILVSGRTIQHHRANIMRKLNIKKTADMVKYAIRQGYTNQ